VGGAPEKQALGSAEPRRSEEWSRWRPRAAETGDGNAGFQEGPQSEDLSNKPVAGGWRLEPGAWRIEACGWRLEPVAGGWRLEAVAGGRKLEA
jgi:uncharacterized cupin superfamily protein